jgi:hypothetical protein
MACDWAKTKLKPQKTASPFISAGWQRCFLNHSGTATLRNHFNLGGLEK